MIMMTLLYTDNKFNNNDDNNNINTLSAPH